MKFVADELGLEEGDITGTWDVAHQLQIIWHRSLKKNPKIIELMKIYFDAMSEFSLVKASTVFKDKAQELGNLVLTSKKPQETRFVRSLLQGLRSAMQNLPTMVSILEEDFEFLALEGKNTEAKIVDKKLKKLKSPENLLRTFGVMQLLELYASTSLEAQHAKHFPTQVWAQIKKVEKELDALSKKWEWSQEEMQYSVLEAPATIVKRLIEEGKYEPKLKMKNLIRKQQELKDAGLLSEEETLKDLFREDVQVIPLSGEVITEEETTREMVKKVEKELVTYAIDITAEWKKRHIQTPLEKAASAVFTKEIFEVKENTREIEDKETGDDEEIVEDLSPDREKRLKGLKHLLKQMPEHQAARFDITLLFPGYESWLAYFRECIEADKSSSEDEVYKNWFRMYVQQEDAIESNVLFSKLFQNIQIRSSSEAMAETVGSVMSNHAGRNRHLQSHNFSKEIVLRFNLGPHHLLEGLVVKVYRIFKTKNKQFVYKRDSKGKLVTWSKDLADK